MPSVKPLSIANVVAPNPIGNLNFHAVRIPNNGNNILFGVISPVSPNVDRNTIIIVIIAVDVMNCANIIPTPKIESIKRVSLLSFISDILSLMFLTKSVFDKTELSAKVGAISTTILLPNPVNASPNGVTPVATRSTQQVIVIRPNGYFPQMNITIMNNVIIKTILSWLIINPF